MDNIIDIIIFLFSGIGATIVGVYLTNKKNRNIQPHTEQITPKTKIASYEPRKTKIKHNFDITGYTTNITSNDIPALPNLNKFEYQHPVTAQESITDRNNLPSKLSNSNTKKNELSFLLNDTLKEGLGFGKLAELATFDDQSFTLASKNDDKIFYGEKNKKALLFSDHSSEMWDDISFIKKKEGISLKKEKTINYNSFSNKDFTAETKRKSIDSLNIGSLLDGLTKKNNTEITPLDLGSIPSDLGEKFMFADKEEGIIISSIHDPEKWSEISFEQTKDEIIYRFRRKK